MISDTTLEGTAVEKAATAAVKAGLEVREFWWDTRSLMALLSYFY